MPDERFEVLIFFIAIHGIYEGGALYRPRVSLERIELSNFVSTSIAFYRDT